MEQNNNTIPMVLFIYIYIYEHNVMSSVLNAIDLHQLIPYNFIYDEIQWPMMYTIVYLTFWWIK